MLRTAVVGMGPIGHRHAAAYSDHPRSQLVAVCDVDEKRVTRAAERFGVPGYRSVGDLLTAEDHLELASVATAGVENGSDHYEPTMTLLEAGVAVLGEKPISNSLVQAREMAQAAWSRGVPYGIDFNHRFTPSVGRAKQWIAEGRIGEVAMVQMRMWIANPNESAPWFHLRSLHPHSFDLLRHYGGDLSEIAALVHQGVGRKIWSNAQVIVRYESGAIGTLTGSYDAGASWPRDMVDIVGSKGRIVVENGYDAVSFYPRDGPEVEIYRNLGGMHRFEDTFPARIGRFVDQVADGVHHAQIEGSAIEAVAAQAAIEAAVESATQRRFVTIER